MIFNFFLETNINVKNLKQDGFVVLLGLILLAVRAWPRLLYPEVWNEDAGNLYGFFNNGISDLLTPVNGYLIVIPKIITMISAIISFNAYPLISIILAWIFTAFVFYTIARSPTYLSGGILLAIACMLVPSDPENYGLPLYTFWWSSLLLFVIIFWDEKNPSAWLRSLFIFFSSLSSPVCLVTLPLFWLRAVLFRKISLEFKLAVFATICTVLQLWAMWPIAREGQPSLQVIHQVIPVFIGGYAVGNIFPNIRWIAGLIIYTFIIVTITKNKSSLVIWGLVYLWVASVLMSVSRVDINIIHPVWGGPRYFFFPFIFQSWLLLQFALTDHSSYTRSGAWFFLMLGIINVYPVLDRKHDLLDWPGHVHTCTQFRQYTIPIHFNGDAILAWDLHWGLNMKGEQCKDLLKNDFVDFSSGGKTYPYRVIDFASNADMTNFPKLDAILRNEWSGSDYYSIVSGISTLPAGYRIIGSFSKSDAEDGMLILRMRRGMSVLFRSEPKSKKQRIVVEGSENLFFDTLPPTSKWTILDFSNRLLPEEFSVNFIDGGSGWGEWSAIALRKD